jgi:hypothetical protein
VAERIRMRGRVWRGVLSRDLKNPSTTRYVRLDESYNFSRVTGGRREDGRCDTMKCGLHINPKFTSGRPFIYYVVKPYLILIPHCHAQAHSSRASCLVW